MVLNLANSQAERGNEVLVVSGCGGEAWKELDERVRILMFDELRRNIGWRDLLVLVKFVCLRYKFRPDIVHLHSSKIGVLGRLAFKHSRIVYTVHGFDSVRIANRKFLFIEKMLRSNAASIVGVSKYDYDWMEKEGIKGNTTYIYNGVPDYPVMPAVTEKPEIVESLRKLREKYGKIVMCIARDAKQKKIDLFFEMARQCPECAFVWIGNLNKYTDLPQNVTLMGSVCNAYIYWKYADLCVLPSNYEGLPISIIEALSYSVPVVASNVGGVIEILNGKNGFAVNNNPEEFVKSIRLVLDDRNWKRMSVEARKSYLEMFTVEEMAERYNSIYDKILGKSKNRVNK